nr:hypothetical protein [Labilibaculum sp.]
MQILNRYSTLENYKLALTNFYENKEKVKTVPWDPCSFNVQLDTPDGSVDIEVQMDEYVLDIAEENDIDLPYSC